jgi:hypothetical protein
VRRIELELGRRYISESVASAMPNTATAVWRAVVAVAVIAPAAPWAILCVVVKLVAVAMSAPTWRGRTQLGAVDHLGHVVAF